MRIFVLLTSCALAAITGVSAAQAPSPEALAALAPRLALSEPTVTNFTVRGTLEAGPFHLRFGVTAARPDSAILSLVDPRDGTPLLFGAGGRVLLYDPLAEALIVASAWPAMKLELETPDPPCHGASERPLLVTEELRGDEAGRQRRAVDSHKGVARAVGAAVEGPRHQLLSGPRLA